jgi:two-component sensor histidine kinase
MALSSFHSPDDSDFRTDASCAGDRIALLDSAGIVVAVNEEWLKLRGRSCGLQSGGVGANYLEVCRQAGSSCVEAREALTGIRAVIKGKLPSLVMDYSCSFSTAPRLFRMSASPVDYESARFVIAHTDISSIPDPKRMEQLQGLSRHLMNARNDERERNERRFNDEIEKRIGLLSSSVSRLAALQSGHSVSSQQELDQIMDRISELRASAQNISSSLHPPDVTRVGIGEALRVLCEQFQENLDIQVKVTIPAELRDVPVEVVTCLFRVAQECLQNIAKHAAAPEVRVILERGSGELRLRISDTGRGFPLPRTGTKAGLGLLSIRERVESLKGTVTIRSAPGTGTFICVAVPLRDRVRVCS